MSVVMSGQGIALGWRIESDWRNRNVTADSAVADQCVHVFPLIQNLSAHWEERIAIC